MPKLPELPKLKSKTRQWPMANRLICAVLALLLPLVLIGQQSKKYVPPDFDRKMDAIRNLEYGVAPLFVLGDLNEDGVVDDKDIQLAQKYVQTKTAAGISCLAAGDVNTDGVVDAKDLLLLQQALKRGPVEAPPLSYHSSLPCDYKNFFIAARSGARPGGTVPIHFLNPRFTIQNSSVIVQGGPATVSRAVDSFVVSVGKTAPPNSLVTLSISLADGKKYVYSFYVHGGPGERRN